MFGFWFPGRHVVAALPLAIPLVAIGLRHAPRVGSVLALVGLAASVWLYVDVRFGSGGLVAGRPDAPFGPLQAIFPLFGRGSTYPFVLAAALGLPQQLGADPLGPVRLSLRIARELRAETVVPGGQGHAEDARSVAQRDFDHPGQVPRRCLDEAHRRAIGAGSGL